MSSLSTLAKFLHELPQFPSSATTVSKSQDSTGFTTVNIQSTDAYLPYSVKPSPNGGPKHWFDTVYDGVYAKNPSIVHKYVENIPVTHTGFEHSFYEMFRIAYANHGEVVLTPDDVWTCISQQFSKYIEQNAEALRHLFVDHEGKKELIVWLNHVDYEVFMEKMMTEITNNSKGDVTKALSFDFSTSGPFDVLMGCLSTMTAMKSYFEYTMICECGLPKIHFTGTLDDWKNLRTKTAFLTKTYAIPDSKYFNLTSWGNDMDLILNEFIETYQGRPKPKFWDSVLNSKQSRIGSGVSSTIAGWILRFISNEDELDTNDIPSAHFDVPVHINDNSHEYNVRVVGGFSGLHIQSNGIIRAQRSYAVICMTTAEQNKLQADVLRQRIREMEQNTNRRSQDIRNYYSTLSALKQELNMLPIAKEETDTSDSDC